jgi:hypothetical protein
MCSKAASCAQGGVAFLWKENDLRFEVESVLFHGPNTLTFQLRTGDERLYVLGHTSPQIARGGWRIFFEQQRRAQRGSNCSSWGT